MRIKVTPNDFIVEEQANLALERGGPWAVYRVRKVGLTTLQVQTRLASILKLSREKIVFPALKDREAITVQFATLPAGRANTIEGEHFIAQRIGFRQRPLSTSDLRGNAFAITMRDLDDSEATRLARRLADMSVQGLPNYFDAQRFGSYAPDWGFIGKAILRRDAKAALYAYFTQPFLRDPRPVRSFKRVAAPLWPDWSAMMDAAPRPSNFRSVLTYLVDHPEGYRKALNLIPQRLLSIYLSAYQSYIWNRVAAAFLAGVYDTDSARVVHVDIADESLPVHTELAPDIVMGLVSTYIPVPHHRVTFDSARVEDITLQILEEEGFLLTDLKARILRRAYLSKAKRRLLLLPQDVQVDAPTWDERFSGRLALSTRFALPRGSYATLVLKAAGSVRSPQLLSS